LGTAHKRALRPHGDAERMSETQTNLSGINENSLRNLIPYKPGQSGNPSGRPKKKPLTEALEAELTPEVCKRIAQKFVLAAEIGSVPHFEQVINRVEGKADSGDGEGSGNVSITIRLDVPRPTVLGQTVSLKAQDDNAG